MFKRLLFMNFRDGNVNFKSVSKAILKVFQFIFVSIVVFTMCNRLLNKVGFDMAVTFIAAANIVVIYAFHIIIHREFLESLKKDGLMMFLREDAFSYVNARINILFIKYLVVVVIPTVLPFILKMDSFLRGSLILLGFIIMAYLMNITVLYGVLFLKKKAEENKFLKTIFFLVAAILFVGFFAILTWVSQIILTIFFERDILLLTDFITKKDLIPLILISILVLIVLSILSMNYMKENIHILYEEERSKEKDNLGIGMKLITSPLIKDKRFIRDVIVFFRDRPFLKMIGIFIVFMQTLSMVAFYFTDIIAPENINDMVNFSQYHFLVVFAISVMCFLLNLIINIGQLRVKEELEMSNQFALEINMKKLIMQKAKGYFMICCLPIILGVALMISLKLHKGSYVEYFYVLIPIIFLFKFISIILIKIINSKGFFREIKIAYAIAVAVGLFLYCAYNLMYSFKLEVPDNRVRFFNILLIFITIIIYYGEVIELKINKEWTKYDRSR